MTLEFQPPYQIDPNRRSDSLQALDTLNKSVTDFGNTMGQWDMQSKEQKYKNMLMQLAQAKEARDADEAARKKAEFGTEYGTRAPSSEVFPTSGPMTWDQSLRSTLDAGSPASPAPGATQGGMVAKFRQWQDQQRRGGGGAPAQPNTPMGMPAPEVGYKEVLPQGIESMGISPELARGLGWTGMSSVGTKQLDQVDKLFKAKKDMGGGDVYTPDQVRSLVPGSSGEKLISSFPGGRVPKDAVHVAATGNRSELSLTERQDQFHTKQWNDLSKRTNPSIAPRGSPLGMAGINNQRADRAIAVLTNPDATDQQLMAGTVDLAAIMHGGAPDEMEIKGQMYGTMRSKWNNLITYVTSNPQAARQPEVQAKLRQMIMDVKAVDNKTIEDNLNSAEEEYADTIARTPERWKRYRQRIMNTTSFLPGTTEGSTDFGPGGQGGGQGGGGLNPGEVMRQSGKRMAVFNSATKQFVRWAQ